MIQRGQTSLPSRDYNITTSGYSESCLIAYGNEARNVGECSYVCIPHGECERIRYAHKDHDRSPWHDDNGCAYIIPRYVTHVMSNSLKNAAKRIDSSSRGHFVHSIIYQLSSRLYVFKGSFL